MSDPSLESDIRKFYESESLSEERVNAILDTRSFVASARRWRRVAVVTSLTTVAMVSVVVGLLMTGQDRGGKRPAVESLEPEHISQAAPAVKQSLRASVPGSTSNYRLVAFRSHDDECPHCRETGQVYRQLVVGLNGADVALELLDLSSVDERTTVNKRVTQLKIGPLIEGRSETAFFALVDDKGNAVQEFKPSQSAARIAATVQELIE